jgi:two-component system, NarL family, nitrate/nitrite response regulator NarL
LGFTFRCSCLLRFVPGIKTITFLKIRLPVTLLLIVTNQAGQKGRKMKEKTSIIMVDDHQIVLDGLTALLEDIADFEILLATTHPAEIITWLQFNKADVLLTDVMMPEMTGQQLAKTVHKSNPGMKILALSMSGMGDTVDEMLNDADINGYVLKNISKAELGKAIRTIAAGGQYFSEEVLRELEKFANIQKDNSTVQLTLREIEIIRLIEKELNNREIADKLFISERTVETHRKNIFRKTQTSSLIGLIKYAYEHKLI